MHLLRRARTGDDAARDELFETCRNYVNLAARTQVESWLQGKVDASDLVQQTMLEAHRGFARFAGTSEGEWLAWLRQILTHNTKDFIRRYRTDKRQAAREIPLHTPAGSAESEFFRDPTDGGATPSEILSRHEDELELADAITRLSPDHQEVIVLRNLQRLPFDEVAERMGRTRPATQMLWTRAIRKLEQLLRETPRCP